MTTPAGDIDVFAFPASFAQERLWFLNAIEPGSPVYNIPVALRLRGKLDGDALRGALQSLVARHESLRTSFASGKDGEILQVVHPEAEAPLCQVDLSSLPAEDREAEARRLMTAEGRHAFDLEQSPLVRFMLLKLDDVEHVLVLNVHHIVADGWSLGVLYRELKHFYTCLKDSLPPDLPPPALQYADYAIWQREWVGTPACEAQIAFWKGIFSDGSRALDLPRDRARPETRRSQGGKVAFEIPSGVVSEIQDVCLEESATPFMFLLSAFQVLLARYSGQEDVTVGCPFANRSRPELESSVGFYTSTVPIRTDLSGDPEFREVLRQVRRFSLNALGNQDAPYERIVEAVNPPRELGHNPLFQVMFAMQKSPEAEFALPDLAVETLDVDNGTAKFDLLMEVQESPRRWKGYIEYDSQMFLEGTIRRLTQNFLTILTAAARAPRSPISALSGLDAAERMTILETWNETQVEYPKTSSVVEFFDQAAGKHTGAIAVLHGELSLTYEELKSRSDKLASLLEKLGAQPGDRVGLACRRSLEMITGVLGILKAGCAYVPMDPEYPRDRLQHMVTDAEIEIVLVQNETVSMLPAAPIRIVNLDDPKIWTEEFPEVGTKPLAGASELAYVIYTSGSTGIPKGVAMPHAPLANLIHWQLRNATVGQGARTLQFSSISFDVSFQEIFATLAAGGTLVLIDEATRRNPLELLRHLSVQKVERIFLPYIALQQLAEAVLESRLPPPGLREVVTAGEQLQVTPEIRTFFAQMPGCRLYNHYGPTESHVVTSHELSGPVEEWPGLPPIGRPIANARIYLVDSRLEPVPIGVPGELMIGGCVLANGYLNRDELTRERFIPDPFSRAPQARMYRTGDVARFLADGTIHYIGRNDQQVKIRGYRIEPGEIEEALKKVSGVREAVVLPKGENSAERHLEAYLLLDPGREPGLGEIRESLRGCLPDYMVPSAYFTIPRLPLTPSGKVDRRAVAALPDARRLEGRAQLVAARDAIERSLVEIWEDVLKWKPIGVTDNFFEVGGTSIRAVKIFARIAKIFGVEIPLATLFKAPNVESLARVVRDRQGARDSSSSPHASGMSSAESFDCLVALTRGKQGRLPLYCVHGVGGNVLLFHALAKALGADQPFYGIQARGVDGRLIAESTIQGMAASYVREIRQAQPKGPYAISGYSSGGIIAFEVAQLLMAAGETIALLAVFDSIHPDYYGVASGMAVPMHELRRKGFWAFTTTTLSWLYLNVQQRLRTKLVQLHRKLHRRLPRFLRAHYLALTYFEALKRYEMKPYPGKLTIFRASKKRFETDPSLGWRKYVAGEIEIVEVKGSHYGIINDAGSADVARVLLERLG